MTAKHKTEVLLVYPPITAAERYGSSLGAAGGRQTPLGVFYLAAALREGGIGADVIDAEATDLSYQDIASRLSSLNCHILGISTTTVAFHRALELATAVKKCLPTVTIIIGGPHVSSQPEHALQFPVFDFAVRNEGEITLLELVKAIRGGQPVKAIQGIVYRDHGTVIMNDPRPYISDINTIPLPAYDLIPDFTAYIPPPCNYKKSPVANIITSRGCPFECTFCANDTFGRTLRLRTAENVVDEIELLMSQYGVREIAFVDDTFTCNKQHVINIFDLARSRGLRFPWTCMARVNTVTDEFLAYMKKSGCWQISFGIESGDERILKEIRKSINIEQAEQAISACHEAGILTKGFFIIGHPLESLESIDRTIELALRLELDDLVVTINTPMPGSYQFDHVDEYGTLDKSSWADFNCWKPVFIPNGLSAEILVEKHREVYRRFYLRPRIIWRYALSFLSLTGARRLSSVLRAAIFLLPSWRKEKGT